MMRTITMDVAIALVGLASVAMLVGGAVWGIWATGWPVWGKLLATGFGGFMLAVFLD